MNQRLRAGKSSELAVASQLIRHGLDVYLPSVDDQAIDLVLRSETAGVVRYLDVQVKSVAGYNRILGLANIAKKHDRYVLVIHYRHDEKPDEFFYLMHEQILKHHSGDFEWGDLIFNKPERERYAEQDLAHLARRVRTGDL